MNFFIINIMINSLSELTDLGYQINCIVLKEDIMLESIIVDTQREWFDNPNPTYIIYPISSNRFRCFIYSKSTRLEKVSEPVIIGIFYSLLELGIAKNNSDYICETANEFYNILIKGNVVSIIEEIKDIDISVNKELTDKIVNSITTTNEEKYSPPIYFGSCSLCKEDICSRMSFLPCKQTFELMPSIVSHKRTLLIPLSSEKKVSEFKLTSEKLTDFLKEFGFIRVIIFSIKRDNEKISINYRGANVSEHIVRENALISNINEIMEYINTLNMLYKNDVVMILRKQENGEKLNVRVNLISENPKIYTITTNCKTFLL